MYTYFSRFLHHTLSYSGLTRIFRWNKFADYCDLDTPVKPECDSLYAGRSMVEMLGVLAIIGVLSVGAIAGYSKAMMKYKLNKHAEQLNQVVNSVIKYVRVMDSYKQAQNLTPLFIKLGEIPVEMLKKDNDNYFYDVFNTRMYIYNEISGNWHALIIYVNLPLLSNSNDSLEICRNVLLVAKENSANINAVYTTSGSGTDDNRKFYFDGDKNCKNNNICLRNMSLDNIYDACTKHLGNQNATLKFEFK